MNNPDNGLTRITIRGMNVMVDLECVGCKREIEADNNFFPNHAASLRCESGRRNHCTCDTCF